MSGKNSILYIYNRNKLRIKNLWQDTIEAIIGSDKDFTKITIRKSVFLLSIPMILEMVMESVFAVADIFFVSKLGADAVAMVGITESLMTIIYAIGIGLSTGTSALIARRSGEKRYNEAGNAAMHSILLGILISLVIAIPGILYAKRILMLMGASEEVAASTYEYTAIMLGSNMVIMLLFIINAIFRSSGDAAVSMRVLWMANIINIILDPCLIFGLGPFPELGLKGAAIATTIGRGLAVAYQVNLLIKGNNRIQIKKLKKIDPGVIGKLVKLSAGGIGQSLIATTSWIGLVRIISIFGNEVLAGYTIAIRIIVFALLPSWGISNAASTLVGQNLGAGEPERAEKSVWTTGIINMVIMGLFGIVFFIIPSFFIRLFISDPVVVNYGAASLRIISSGFLFYALGMVVVQAFNGAGDTYTPTRINLFCFWLLEIPLAYFLAIQAGLKETGVYIAIVTAETIMALIGIYYFKKGKWKLRKV